MKHRYLFVVPNYWGAGESDFVAIARARTAGANKEAVEKGPAILYSLTYESELGDGENGTAECFVDGYGSACWTNMELVEKVTLREGRWFTEDGEDVSDDFD